MKRIMIQIKDDAEHLKVKAEAANLGLTISNYFRTGRGLEPVKKAGAPIGNHNRAKGVTKPKPDE